MFSELALYPGGVAGAGLLLLRISVASSLIVLSGLQSDAFGWLQVVAIVAAIGLCAGIWTRAAGLLSLGTLILLFATGKSVPLVAALQGLNALALTLTGPGAWSADAVLFGRRAVKLPDRD